MRTLIALAVMAWTTTAVAREPDVIYKRHTVVVFDDDTVDGRLDRADLGAIDSRKNTRHASLIHQRRSFRSEILSSVRAF